jgi:hypothetical protein
MGRLVASLQRAVLGGLITVTVSVLERRIRRALKKRAGAA